MSKDKENPSLEIIKDVRSKYIKQILPEMLDLEDVLELRMFSFKLWDMAVMMSQNESKNEEDFKKLQIEIQSKKNFFFFFFCK